MNYSPYGYNPYTPYTGYAPQPQQTHLPTQGGPDWIMAPTIKHVEQVNVQPGQKSWVMVQNEPIFALRTADQMGLVTTDYYRFEKINPDAITETGGDYITRKEFEAFVASLKADKEAMA